MANLSNLPQRQREVLHFIVREIEDKGQSPTQDEIAAGLGMVKGQVSACLDALENKGKIKRTRYGHRSIEVVK
ncbi:MAG: winged helix-turn-helix transcriptional regulator [Desulfurellales bacterium]|nr:MAG: winged helix-turn-helix transcriptional regulator [Desulfurellales bacterium]